jgi:protein SCO1/2
MAPLALGAEPGRAAINATEAVNYVLPDVDMVTSNGRTMSLRSIATADKTIMLNFIFTSCQAICPAMSGTFSQLQRRLGPEMKHVRLISVSIDPETDSPTVLRDYAARFQAGPHWLLLTGTRQNVAAIQRGFENYSRNKMDHAAVVFMRPAHATYWVRIEGFPTAEALIGEYRMLATH